MNKLLVAFALLFFFFTLIDSVVMGSGGVAVTQLRNAITATDTTMTVTSTRGYLSADFIRMGNEKVSYNGKDATHFYNLSRGQDGTIAVIHTANEKIYSPDADVLNAALGYGLINTAGSGATFSFFQNLGLFFTVTIPKLITWNFSFLDTDYGIYIRYILIAVSLGLTITVIIQIAQSFGGILQGGLNR